MITIDSIYVLNIPGRTDRLLDSAKELHKYGIPAKIFPATKMKDGAEGLRQTMRHLFTNVLKTNFKNILVLEDDFSFLINPHEMIPKFLEQLPEEFHCAYLGANLLARPERVSDNVLKLSAAYATHAIIYSREAIEIIMKNLHDSQPYDLILNKTIQKMGRCYIIYPMICTQRDSPSDIANYDEYANNPQTAIYVDPKTKSIKWGAMMQDRMMKMTTNI